MKGIGRADRVVALPECQCHLVSLTIVTGYDGLSLTFQGNDLKEFYLALQRHSLIEEQSPVSNNIHPIGLYPHLILSSLWV